MTSGFRPFTTTRILALLAANAARVYSPAAGSSITLDRDGCTCTTRGGAGADAREDSERGTSRRSIRAVRPAKPLHGAIVDPPEVCAIGATADCGPTAAGACFLERYATLEACSCAVFRQERRDRRARYHAATAPAGCWSVRRRNSRISADSFGYVGLSIFARDRIGSVCLTDHLLVESLEPR